MIHRIVSVIAAFSLVFVPGAAHASEDMCAGLPPEVRHELAKYGWNC